MIAQRAELGPLLLLPQPDRCPASPTRQQHSITPRAALQLLQLLCKKDSKQAPPGIRVGHQALGDEVVKGLGRCLPAVVVSVAAHRGVLPELMVGLR